MRRILAIAVLLLPLVGTAQDEPPIHPYLESKFYASVGLFVTDQDMKLSLDGSVEFDPEPQPYIDFEQTLGTSNSDQTFSAEFGWRFSRKWQMRGQYFRIENSTRAVLEEDVEWGDYVFNAGSNIGAGADMQITRLFFGRTFSSSQKHELGFGLGGHIIDLAAFVSGDALLNGQPAGFVQERASISQPLPNIGGWYMHAFSPKFALTLRLDWLAASIDEYDGHIVNAAASLGYAVSDHFGIAAAYNFFEIDINVTEPDWHGGIRTRFNGPYISLTGYW